MGCKKRYTRRLPDGKVIGLYFVLKGALHYVNEVGDNPAYYLDKRKNVPEQVVYLTQKQYNKLLREHF